MYYDSFGLRCPPFDDRSEPRFFHPTDDCRTALELLRRTASGKQGPVLLTGGEGLGKSILCRVLLSRLDRGAIPVLGTCSTHHTSGLIQRVCRALNIEQADSPSSLDLLDRLRRFVSDPAGEHPRWVLLCLDQAENLTPADLEELGLLSEVREGDRHLVRIVLAGRPGIEDTLRARRFKRLRRRIAGPHTLSPLSLAETREYVRHRLLTAGAPDNRLFDLGALNLIQEHSGGVPRRINQLCDEALRTAHRLQRGKVDRVVVTEVCNPGHAAPPAAGPQLDPAVLARTAEQLESLLSAGRTLGEQLEDAIRRANELGLGTDASDALRELKALAEVVRHAPESLAETESRLESAEERIETACRQARELAETLEEASTANAGQQEDSARQCQAVSEACARAEAVRVELSEYAGRIVEVGAEAQRHLATLIEEVDAEDGIASVLAATTRAREELTATLEDVTRRADDLHSELERAFGDTAARINDVRAELEHSAQEAIGRAGDARDGLLETIDAATRQATRTRKDLGVLTEQAEEEATRTRAQLNATLEDAAARATEISSGLNRSADAAAERVTGIRVECTEQVQRVQKQTAAAEAALRAAVDDAARCGNEARQEILRTVATASQETTELRAEVARSHEEADAVRRELTAAIEAAAHGAGEARQRLDTTLRETEQQAADVRNGILVSVGEAADARSELAGAIERAIEQVERTDSAHDRMDQAIARAEERSAAIGEAIAETARTASDQAAGACEQITRTIGRATERGAGVRADIEQTLRKAVEQTTSTCDQIAETVGQATEQAAGIRADLEQAARQAVDQAGKFQDALRVEMGAADRKAEQLESIISSAREVGRQTGATVADAHTAAGELLSKVEQGQGTAREIEQSLERGLGDARGVTSELQELLAGARAAAEELRAEKSIAAETTGQLASMTQAAREALRQASGATADSHSAADRLLETVDSARAAADADLHRVAAAVEEARCTITELKQELQQATQDAEQARQATAEQTERAESAGVTAAEAINRLEERITSSQRAHERMDQLTRDIWSLACTAEERAHQLGERTGHAEQFLDRLEKSAASAGSLSEALAAEIHSTRQVIGTLESRCRQGVGVDRQLQANAKAAARVADESGQVVQQAREATQDLGQTTAEAQHLVARLANATEGADQTAERLSEQREAARATLERQQTLHDHDRDLVGQLEAHAHRASELMARLAELNSEAAQRGQSLADSGQQAARTAERLAEQVEAVGARQEVLDASERTLSEFIQHAESISRQLEKLQSRADAFEVHVSRLLEGPERIASDAKAQSAQLQGVCRAVRKVFASLSQATVEANKRVEQFQKMSRTAESRANHLSAETTRASDTLRAWVNEAMRVQSRLAESLAHSPSVAQTHPPESLRMLASLAGRQGRPEARELELPPAAEPVVRHGMIGGGPGHSRSRTEEINQLLEDARQLAQVAD